MHMLNLEEHWFTQEHSHISHEKPVTLMSKRHACDTVFGKSLRVVRKWLRVNSHSLHKNKRENNKSYIYYHIIVCNNEPEITI